MPPITTTTTAVMSLLTITLLNLITDSSGEVKTVKLHSDLCRMILFENFGFTQLSLVVVDVSHVIVTGVTKSAPNMLGFFFVDQYSFQQLLKELEKDSRFCALVSIYITLLFSSPFVAFQVWTFLRIIHIQSIFLSNLILFLPIVFRRALSQWVFIQNVLMLMTKDHKIIFLLVKLNCL